MPTVSVIMNCYNGEKFLREAIDSVYAQTYKDWEIVLWDDASTDGTERIARSYDDKLRYFRGEKSPGLGHARNLALRQARGEFLAFLDQDDLWLPSKLEKQVPLFEAPEVGLVFSDSIFFDSAGKEERLYGKLKYHFGECFADLLRGNFLSIETVVIRRSALDALDSWFDPGFNLCEEYDLFMRIAYKWKIAVVDQPLARWRMHSSSLTWKSQERGVEERNLILSKFRKIFPGFSEEYAREISIYTEFSSIFKAKNSWKSRGAGEARRILIPIMFKNRKAFAWFFLTFFSPETVSYVTSKLIRRGAVYPV